MANEGNRGHDGAFDGPETYGHTANEPSHHRGDDGPSDDGSPYQTSQNGGIPNSNGQNYGQSSGRGNQGYQGNASSGGGYQTGGYGNSGNEPSRYNGGFHTDTTGNIGNQPSRHRDIDIYVQSPNSGQGPVSMTANSNWTLGELHNKSARRCNMDPSQCHSNCNGKPLSGSTKIHQTDIKNGSRVVVNCRLKGG